MAWATRPPVQDSAVATVTPWSRQAACSRPARSARSAYEVGGVSIDRSAPVGLLRIVGRCEEPRLGVALRGHVPEVDAVHREVGRAGLAGPDLNGLLGVERQDLARGVDPTRRP